MYTVAIHIIFTTYGTWLPGDDRGHWSPLFDFYGHLIRTGHQLNMSDEVTSQIARASLTEPPKCWISRSAISSRWSSQSTSATPD